MTERTEVKQVHADEYCLTEEELRDSTMSSFCIFDEDQPAVVLRSPGDCSSYVPRRVPAK
jgi:hypothetical protein